MAAIIKVCIDIIVSDLGDIFICIRQKVGKMKMIERDGTLDFPACSHVSRYRYK